jgi:hypothetical protein
MTAIGRNRGAWLRVGAVAAVALALCGAPSASLAAPGGRTGQAGAKTQAGARRVGQKVGRYSSGAAQGLTRLYKPKQAAKLAQASTAALEKAQITEAQYQAMVHVGLTLIKMFPPQNHRYISLGRSATQLVAVLQNLEPERAINLPMTGMRSAPAESLHPQYFEHLQKMIPDRLLAHGETLVLMDLAVSGSSLKNTEVILKKYLEHRGFTNKVEVLTFSSVVNGPDGKPYANIPLTQTAYPLDPIMRDNERGEYPSYIVGTTSSSELERLPFYDQQKEALMMRMQHDETLDKQLSKGN